MKRILIADSSKASLVMTSEVFKDHYPGIQVLVARNAQEAVTLAKANKDVDAFIIDYDLPDKNGAETALLLKKIAKTPILITAFDQPHVVENIETTLEKYDDCKSWLKKPVNPEVVIAVAQRYCEGKIRTQKRIPCHLPVLASLTLTGEGLKLTAKTKEKSSTKTEKVTPLKNTAKSQKTETPANKKPQPILFFGIVEDCSLSGVKLKPSKSSLEELTDWSLLLKQMEQIAKGQSVTLSTASFFDIEFGKNDDFSKIKVTSKETKKASSSKTKSKKSEKQLNDINQELNGKIAWTSADSGEWCLGIEFEDQSLSKKLFEAIVANQTRQHKSSQSQSMLKTTRLGNQ